MNLPVYTFGKTHFDESSRKKNVDRNEKKPLLAIRNIQQNRFKPPFSKERPRNSTKKTYFKEIKKH
jgi:hypothetical protein